MANSFTIVPGRVAVIARNVGHAKFTIASTETYATPTGITVDFYVPFVDAGINPNDVQEITGYTPLGYLAVFTKGTLTSSSYPWTVRLWNGVTEIADGALSDTIHANVIYYPGAK